jgi:ATP-dependent DNA ligase
MKPCKLDFSKKSHAAKLEEALRDGSGYIAEEKLDGCHYLMIGGRFFSTRISDVTGWPVEKTHNFPHLTEFLDKLGVNDLILDGEICLPGKKSQDVISITGSYPEIAVINQQEFGWVEYRVFDILRTPNGEWLFQKPWVERRQLLEDLFELTLDGCTYLKLNPVQLYNKKAFLYDVINQGAEGIVLKDVNGKYYPGKRPMWNWIKVKQEDSDDAIIIGFEPPTRNYTGKNINGWQYWGDDGAPVTKHYAMKWIGAIILGKYKEGNLVRIGTCSGMTEHQRTLFTDHPDEYIGKVARIKMMERTNDGNYRHPSFIDIHPDKHPEECIL